MFSHNTEWLPTIQFRSDHDVDSIPHPSPHGKPSLPQTRSFENPSFHPRPKSQHESVWNQLHLDELLSMTKEWYLRRAKLLAITIASTEALAPPKEVFLTRKHVSCVEYKFDDAPSEWDILPS